MMKFFRGLNLDKFEIEFIKTNGDCDINKGAWLSKPAISHHNLDVIDIIELLKNESDTIERYAKESNDILKFGKYVTSCFEGASIYSNDHHNKEQNIVLEIESNIENVFIDGRDFLYVVIPKLIKNRYDLNLQLTNKMIDAFGEKIVDYIKLGQVLANRNQNILFRLVDYICMDKTIIKAHYDNNKILIIGRYSTKFFGAFAIIGGINASMINKIKKAKNINRETPISLIKENINTIELREIYEHNCAFNFIQEKNS